MPASRMRCQQAPSKVTTGAVQRALRRRSAPRCACRGLPKLSFSGPSYSTSFQPTPMPRRSRPPLGERPPRRRLLVDERGLPLRQDDHVGDQLATRSVSGASREVTEEDERLVEERVAGVRPAPARKKSRRSPPGRGRRSADVVVAPAPSTACAQSRTAMGSLPISVCGKTAPNRILHPQREVRTTNDERRMADDEWRPSVATATAVAGKPIPPTDDWRPPTEDSAPARAPAPP